MTSQAERRIAIVGGGISGLALAHALRERAARVRAGGGPAISLTVFERSDRAGGNLRTETIDRFVCEWGPNGFLDSVPETLELVRAVGLEERLQPSDDAARRRFIFRRGRLREVPTGPASFLATRLLSTRGKARIALEPLAKRRPEGDETIHAFAARRIGREAADILIDAMVSGVFAGDARRLSLRACFPKMWQMESDHGGLFRALLARRHAKRRGAALGAPAGRLTSFRGGTEELPAALVRHLGTIVATGCRVLSVLESHGRAPAAPWSSSGDPPGDAPCGSGGARVPWSGYTLDLGPQGTARADAVVLAGPASESARIVRDLDGPLARELGAIPTAPVSVVCLGYDRESLRRPLDGFGLLVPRGEGPRLLGVLWDSSLFPGRAPEGRVLLRAMIGGAQDPEGATLPDPELVALALSDLRATMGLTARPVLQQIFRHSLGIPQYEVGHLERLDRIERSLARHPGLFLTGNSYRGVSMNSCIAEAGPLAERILAGLDDGDRSSL